jgi:uncharacterized protein (DUF1330 family)
MSYERLVGLDIADEGAYSSYREGMLPILQRYGGSFRYDFRIEETLRSETTAAINRVFLLAFPSLEAKAAFFADPDYLAVRERHFKPSVRAATVIAEFER